MPEELEVSLVFPPGVRSGPRRRCKIWPLDGVGHGLANRTPDLRGRPPMRGPVGAGRGFRRGSEAYGVDRKLIADITDLALVDWLSGGKVDLTFGS